jgi:signal transduction histidine kinase
MRIRHKILAGYLALVVAAVILVAFFLFTIADINSRYSDLITRDQGILLQANNLRSGAQRQIVAARSYELSPDISLLVEYNDAVQQQTDAIKKITPLLMTVDDRNSLEDIKNASATYTQLADQSIEFVGQGANQSSSNPSIARSETARLALINMVEGFIVRKNQQVSDAQATLSAHVEEVSAQLLAWSLVAVFLTLIAVTLFTESFTAPLRRLMRNVQRIARGDLQTPIVVRSHDEIGELAGVLEEMRRRLSSAAAENESLLASARQEADKLAAIQSELERANIELHHAFLTELDARKRIEDIDKMKSEFASMTSHELKTPVSYIYNYAGALKEHGVSLNDGQRTEFLTAIQGESQHLLTLIDDILAMSLLDAGGLTYHFVETDLRKMADAVVRDHQLTTRRHTITIKGPEHVPVRADPTRLKQVLNNLLSNAIKYSPQGGPIEVRLRANEADGTAMIYVRDNGLGIGSKDIPQLFEKYSRIQRKETVAIPGSGLGLYIAHQIIEAHGGDLTLEPAPGKGTIAEITIPLLTTSPEDEEDAAGETPASQRRARMHRRQARAKASLALEETNRASNEEAAEVIESTIANSNGRGPKHGHVVVKQTEKVTANE